MSSVGGTLSLATTFGLLIGANSHGSMNFPPTRMSTNLKIGAGQCEGSQMGAAPQFNMTCYWFNEGCSIGCKSCGGVDCGHEKVSIAGKCCPEQMRPTLKDPKLRTFHKPAFIAAIAYEHTPWRAPGFAPVYDSCGTAGGIPEGGKWEPINIPPAGVKQGISGQDLPPFKDGKASVWAAGSIQEVAWGINANHGGGYAYRLCPKAPFGSRLSEACFEQHHLQFVGNQSWIQYGEDRSNRTAIPAIRTSEGTHPAGSQWTKNPIPACGSLAAGGIGSKCGSAQFEPPLADIIKPHPVYAPLPGLYGYGMGHCQGLHPKHHGSPEDLTACSQEELEFWRVRFSFNIIDEVQIPLDLPAGEYLLSFRWDCEQTPQIWTNCADVTIVQPGSTTHSDIVV